MHATKEILESSEYSTVSSVAEGSVSSEAAAQKLGNPVSELFKKSENESEVELQLWKTWNAVIETASRTPHADQDWLVGLLKDIERLQQPTKDDGAGCRVWNLAVWKDLPVFGAAMRERWNTEPHTEESWVNLNAFAARLTTLQASSEAPDFSLYGIWALREVLEDPSPTELAQAASANGIKAAAVWFVYSSEPLWRLSKEEKTFEGKVARPGRSLHDKEWRGFREERWQEWVERFHKLLELDIDTDAKNMITCAIRETARVTQR